jgi:hypothetical protein
VQGTPLAYFTGCSGAQPNTRFANSLSEMADQCFNILRIESVQPFDIYVEVGDCQQPVVTQPIPIVTFTSSAQTVGVGSSVSVQAQLYTNQALTAPVAVSLATDPSSTASAADYSLQSSAQMTFEAGSTNGATRSVNLMIAQDAVSEGVERLVLELVPTGGNPIIGQPNTHVITIDNTAAWAHRFDFTQGTLGWTTQDAIETGKSWGQYVPGSGWEDSGEKANNPSDFHTQAAAISRSFPQRTLSKVKVVYDLQNADDEPSRGMMLGPNYFGYIYQLNIGNETNAIYTIPLNPPAVTNYVAVFVASDRGTPNSNPPNPEDDQGKGDVMIREVWLYGVPGETNPFL